MQLRPHQQRAFDAMQQKDCGQIIVPTGGGKTYIAIADCVAHAAGSTAVVVAPRILLANQLCEVHAVCVCYWTHVCHAHSGKTPLQRRKPELLCSTTLREQQVSPALSLPPIILCTAL